jgi:LPS-assembly protein
LPPRSPVAPQETREPEPRIPPPERAEEPEPRAPPLRDDSAMPAPRPQPPPPTPPPVATPPPAVAALPRPTRDREVEVMTPALPGAPRVKPPIASGELRPPTEDVRLWTVADDGTFSWSAQESVREVTSVTLKGRVDIHAGPDRIQADEVTYDETTGRIVATGNVSIDHLDARLAGSRLEYDVRTNTGTVWDVFGTTGNDLNFTGSRAEKVGPDKYVVHDGSFTSCTQPLPIWQVKASKAIIHVDRFVYTWNPRVFFKKVPAYYLPYALFPIKQDRSTGFMVPKVSNSSLRGVSIEDEFFWAINRSVDLTIGGHLWSEYGWRGDVESRWFLDGMRGPGYVEGAFFHSNDEEVVQGQPVDQDRYHLRFEHVQQVFDHWDLTARGEAGSDHLLDEEFVDLQQLPQPVFNQRVSLQRRWGKHSFNIYLENDTRENVSASFTQTTHDITRARNLPLLEYRSSGLQLFGKKALSLTMEGSVGWFGSSARKEYVPTTGDGAGLTTIDHDYTRADFYPQLRFPFGPAYLQVVPSVNVRGTWWSRKEAGTRTVIDDGQSFNVTDGVDESTFLWAWDAGLLVEGPDFERIFNVDAKPGQRKWQHVIQPQLDYRHRPDLREVDLITADQRAGHYLGRLQGTDNRLTLRVVNTIRSKRVVPEGSTQESARDLVIWTVSTDYDFDDPASTGTVGGRTETNWFADVTSDVNWKPAEDIHFTLRNTYDVLQDDITDTTLSGGVDAGWGYVDLTLSSRRDPATLDDDNTELGMTGEAWFYKGDRLRLGWDFTKDFHREGQELERSSWPYRRLVVSYYNQCCGVSLSWEDNDQRSVRREKEWTFIVTLKNVGNYLRYRERSTD